MELLLFFIGVYFLPFIIALARRSPQTVAIFFLNLLAGWTLIGWVGAFVWAVITVPGTGRREGGALPVASPSRCLRQRAGTALQRPRNTASSLQKVHPGWKDLRS